MYELKVEGMTCGGCAASVRRALETIDPNANVQVDLPSKTVRVETSAALNEVKSAIEDAGYDVFGAV